MRDGERKKTTRIVVDVRSQVAYMRANGGLAVVGVLE